MSDIVERLRELADHEGRGVIADIVVTLREAADEIERLRRQLSRQEWAESADRALMQEEIEYLKGRR